MGCPIPQAFWAVVSNHLTAIQFVNLEDRAKVGRFLSVKRGKTYVSKKNMAASSRHCGVPVSELVCSRTGGYDGATGEC
jgi:hypothetical protein